MWGFHGRWCRLQTFSPPSSFPILFITPDKESHPSRSFDPHVLRASVTRPMVSCLQIFNLGFQHRNWSQGNDSRFPIGHRQRRKGDRWSGNSWFPPITLEPSRAALPEASRTNATSSARSAWKSNNSAFRRYCSCLHSSEHIPISCNLTPQSGLSKWKCIC